MDRRAGSRLGGDLETLPPSRTGINFIHSSGITERRRLPESIAPGVAILDYNGDGRMDVFFVNSAGPHALYRNDGDLKFTTMLLMLRSRPVSKDAISVLE